MLNTLSRSALLLSLTACYTYQPLSMPEPQVGTRVSVQLTDDGSRQLGNQIGLNVLHVEGDLMAIDSSALDLSVRQTESQRGEQINWRGERVLLPRQTVAGMQQRRLSVGGTGLLVGISVVALAALYQAISGSGLFEGNPGSGGGSPQQ